MVAECVGLVDFGEKKKEKNLVGKLKQQRRAAMILNIKDKPVACSVCGKSYFEWELK